MRSDGSAWESLGYRFYETGQLEVAARIRTYRQLGLSIDEIKAIYIPNISQTGAFTMKST